jgi:GTP:adenosylcobinamide-phosphate guanylyltransferase
MASQNTVHADIPICQDSIVNSVIKKFAQRSEFGQKKYGTNLDRTDLTVQDWITHAQEELMDGILYLEKLKQQTHQQIQSQQIQAQQIQTQQSQPNKIQLPIPIPIQSQYPVKLTPLPPTFDFLPYS